MSLKTIGCFLCLLFGSVTYGQNGPLSSLQLVEAYSLLEARYPLLRNGELIDQLTQTQQAQLTAERRPIIALKADGRLQSENVNLESDNAMFPLRISRPLVTAQTYLDVNYRILDGRMNAARQDLLTAQNKVQQQQLKVDCYQLRGRLNQLFLTLTSLRTQTDLLAISLANLRERKRPVTAGVEEGLLLSTELTQLEVKEQELLAQEEALEYQQRSIINQLEYLLNITLSSDVELVYPALPAAAAIPALQRPEQHLFQLQQEAILTQEQLATAERKPQLNVFAQAGYGFPNPLNFLDDGAAPYGIIGIGFSWRLLDWNKSQLQAQTRQLQAAQVQHTRETFEFNLNQLEVRYRSDLERISAQITREEEIARLQAQILEQLAAQLEEGVITAIDYVNQLNNELRARQKIEYYTTQLRNVQLEFWHERGHL